MADEVTPALTREEWELYASPMAVTGGLSFHAHARREGDALVDHDLNLCWNDPNHRHTISALALYGQPFGFTREDVDLLLNPSTRHLGDVLAHARSLAARIAALLPPEDAHG